jgi:tetratricopeptide (TPR) repeat protein
LKLEKAMNRIETAIREGRCVLALGQQALTNPEVLGELRRRSVPAVHLGGEAIDPVQALGAANLSAVLEKAGGVLVLVEPDGASDGRALSELGELIKAAGKKPKIFVAARAFNPFMMPMNMRLMKMEGLKFRARDFIASLPVIDAVASTEPNTKARKKKNRPELPFKAPQALFVGREEEVAQFSEALGSDGGPIVVTGPRGIGKRWLIEHSLIAHQGPRWPDLTFGPGIGADTLLARIAAATNEAGVTTLHEALRQKDGPNPAEIAALAAQALADETLKGAVWVIHGIEGILDRRRGHLLESGRLEMVLSAILASQPAVRIVFASSIVPQLYTKGTNAQLRVITLGGLKGSVLHELFAAHHVPEFSRDRFGPIAERTLGHPLAARYLAISATEEEDIEELLEQKRFLKMETLDRNDALSRHIKRRIGSLSQEERGHLSACALFNEPATTDDLRLFGLDRKARLFLIAKGLLEQTPVDGDRRYYVHPLVAKLLEYREVYEFDTMQALGQHFHQQSREYEKQEGKFTAGLACVQEGNRLLVESRRERSALRLPYSDLDTMVYSIQSMMNRKKARLDIARSRLNSLIKFEPKHPELLLLNAQLHHAEKSEFSQIIGAFNDAQRQAPTPNVFMVEADIHTRSRARGKAARAMELALKTFPDNGRLYRRLAGIYLDQNKLDEAIVLLKSAMTLEPLMPDTYGMLGEAYTAQGVLGWENATSALNEALSIDPENPRNLVRKATLLRDQGLAAEEGREAFLSQADEAVKAALEVDKGYPVGQELAAMLILDMGGDPEQAEWFLNQCLKRRETSNGLVQRARVMIRKGTLDDVEQLIAKALKKEPSNHAAFAVQSEMWEGQGQIFHAFEAIKSAKERSPKDSASRAAYEREMARLGAMIESGAAAEMMKAAGLDITGPIEATPESTGERRDPGTTTIRRPKKGEATEASAETEQTAEVDAETVQAAETAEVDAETVQAAETAEVDAETVQAAETAEVDAEEQPVQAAETTEASEEE